jgi:hypothetical protein
MVRKAESELSQDDYLIRSEASSKTDDEDDSNDALL